MFNEYETSPEMGYYLLTSSDGQVEIKLSYQGLLDKFKNDANIAKVMNGYDNYWSVVEINPNGHEASFALFGQV